MTSPQNFPDGHATGDALRATAVGEPKPAGDGQKPTDALATSAVPGLGPFLKDKVLKLLGDQLVDTEDILFKLENRYRSFTQSGDVPGGHGMDPSEFTDLPFCLALVGDGDMSTLLPRLITMQQGIAAELVKALEKRMEQHPLGPWVKAQGGIGYLQAARLLGAIGDPYWMEKIETGTKPDHPSPRVRRVLESRPRRGPAELWAYCGLDPREGAIRRPGDEDNKWHRTAKSRVWLVADSCIHQIEQPAKDYTIEKGKYAGQVRHRKATPASPYRVIYDQAKAKYVDAAHYIKPCAWCGTKGNPAPLGSPLKPRHIEARARTIVMKEILKDLWRESKRLHEQQLAVDAAMPRSYPLAAQTSGDDLAVIDALRLAVVPGVSSATVGCE